MPLRNLEWYNLNCTRPYPFDDQATLVDVNGNRLDHNLLVDLNLLIPRAVGQYVHVGGISLGESLATITFVASENSFDTGNLVPVAAVSVQNPEKYVHYPIESLYPGVGGWVVWGTAVDQDKLLVHKFASGRQSLLLPRAARAYQGLPVETMGKLHGASLTGLVHLSAGTDIEIVKECLTINDYPPERASLACDTGKREVIVIRLKETQDEGAVTLPEEVERTFAAQQNIYDRFRGPCGGRPESNTCGSPEPIETVNAVSPDCCGNITLRFTGCAKLTDVQQEVILDDIGEEVQVDDACGVVVDCGLDLTEACPDDTIPDVSGKRRWETDVLCVSESITTAAPPVDDTPAGGGSGAGLPFSEDFYDPIDGLWELTMGFWGSIYYTPDSVGGWDEGAVMNGYFTGAVKDGRQAWGSWAENSFAMRNNLVWEGGVDTYWRKCYATFVPVVDDQGSNYPRFGILFNHRAHPTLANTNEWWSVEFTRAGLHIIHFDGEAEHLIFESHCPPIEQNQDMFMSVGIYPHYYSDTLGDWTGATLYAQWQSQNGADGTIGPIYLENFAPDSGNFGLTSKNCHVLACNFEVHYSGTPG